jgi:hypothetical protein
MIGVVVYNADNLSALLPATGKSALISVHVRFSALLPSTPIIFPRCRPQRGKIIGVVVYTVEQLLTLSTTTWKNVRIRISPLI